MAPVMMIALLLFEWWRRRRIPRGNYLPAILILIATPLLWFVPAVIAGGEAFWREIFYKQTVGRAVGAWVHKSPPWFYVTHAPGTLFPWFFLLVAALVRLYRRPAVQVERPASPAIQVHTAGELIAMRHDPKFYVSWILAVLVPYSLLSSKLDVYMMAMIPPVALLIGHYLIATTDERWGRRANAFVLALFVLIGLAGATVASRFVKDAADRALAESWSVRCLFVVMAIGGAIGFVVALRSRVIASTIAVGATLIATLAYAGLVLTPAANELATTRPLVRAISALQVPPEQIALHACPHLWVRGMSPALERVRYVDAADLGTWSPAVIVTSRKHDDAIAAVLARYRKSGEFRMIGKWFDVYTR
jgi:4-amino-4-deoxy-L-arabinose transferase-like glycosyltransferase